MPPGIPRSITSSSSRRRTIPRTTVATSSSAPVPNTTLPLRHRHECEARLSRRDGKLAPGEVWRQESVIGTVFEGCYETAAGGIIPTITGRAHVVAETVLLFGEEDPFRWGIGSETRG